MCVSSVYQITTRMKIMLRRIALGPQKNRQKLGRAAHKTVLTQVFYKSKFRKMRQFLCRKLDNFDTTRTGRHKRVNKGHVAVPHNISGIWLRKNCQGSVGGNIKVTGTSVNCRFKNKSRLVEDSSWGIFSDMSEQEVLDLMCINNAK